MNIIFHGAAQEVGKSCIEIRTEGKRYLLDAGVKFIPGGIEYPRYLDRVQEIDGIFLSHAHLDHSGALPLLEHKQLDCPIYTTQLTWDISNLMLEDSYHLEKLKHLHPAYVERDIKKVTENLRFVRYDKEYQTSDKQIRFWYLNAGHIPGSASILMEIEGKRLLYTADINTETTNLLYGSKVASLRDIDILITENTYGDRPHPNRKESEEKLLETVEQGLKRDGGSILLPVFSVGRSQEMLILLSRLKTRAPIYLDGMPRELTRKILHDDDEYIRNREILEDMFSRVHVVKSKEHREKVARMHGIIILSSSGMVQGGPSTYYAEQMINKQENTIILSGFQAKGTVGRHLFEDHIFYKHHETVPVKAQIHKFDFSAHLGQDSIHKIMQEINAEHVILQHGDLESLEAVNHAMQEKIDGKIYIPEIGEELHFP